jgi:hypothetical protein
MVRLKRSRRCSTLIFSASEGEFGIHMLNAGNEMREDVVSEMFADPTRWLGNGSRMAG